MSPAARQTDAGAVLGIETATGRGSVALWAGGGVAAELLWHDPRSHSERLLPSLELLLRETGLDRGDVAAVAVSAGPGSFTGLRVGFAAAKGLAYGLDVPLYGVPTLEVLAAAVPPVPAPVCAVVDARRGEVFAALFAFEGGSLVCREAERAVAPGELAAGLAPGTVIAGEPPPALRSLLEARGDCPLFPPGLGFPRASTAARLGAGMLARGLPSGLDTLLPLYVRPSDAEWNAEKKRSRAKLTGRAV